MSDFSANKMSELYANVALPGYEAGPGDSGVEHSIRKLKEATTRLAPHIPQHIPINSIPCEQEDDSWSYRCKCTFQILHDEETNQFHYAMRSQKQPIILGADYFPIASLRIQQAMKDFSQTVLNNGCPKDDNIESFANIKQHLTSVTFS